jgi:threonine synthase
MTFVEAYQCTICHKRFPPDERTTCDVCGDVGILDVIYDYQAMKKVVTRDYFKKQTRQDIFRYLPLMSVEDTHIDATLRVGMTPLYKANHLEKHLDMTSLYIKDEGVNPSA